MLKISAPPPRLVNESWKELTAPVDVPVVETAKSAEAHSPNRVSLPSMDAPAAWNAVPGWFTSRSVTLVTRRPQITPIAARIA